MKAVVNGKEIPGAHITGDRTYVSAEAFAAAMGATFGKNANGVYEIATGMDVPAVAKLAEINPALSKYQALSPYIPSMGVHQGVQGPGLVTAVSNEATLNAVEIMVPEAAGWQPWFDEPEGQPIEIEGMGKVYTQHIYITSPAGLMPEDGGVPVIVGGRYLSSDYQLKGHMMGEDLYIPLRPAVELLGGEIAWDDAAHTASATVEAKAISYEWLKQLNPALSLYQPISEFVPNMGVHNGVQGPHITVLTDSEGNVPGFELVSPAAAGWFPWFDQPENQPMELPGLGEVYTQHIYLVDPAGIK